MGLNVPVKSSHLFIIGLISVLLGLLAGIFAVSEAAAGKKPPTDIRTADISELKPGEKAGGSVFLNYGVFRREENEVGGRKLRAQDNVYYAIIVNGQVMGLRVTDAGLEEQLNLQAIETEAYFSGRREELPREVFIRGRIRDMSSGVEKSYVSFLREQGLTSAGTERNVLKYCIYTQTDGTPVLPYAAAAFAVIGAVFFVSGAVLKKKEKAGKSVPEKGSGE